MTKEISMIRKTAALLCVLALTGCVYDPAALSGPAVGVPTVLPAPPTSLEGTYAVSQAWTTACAFEAKAAFVYPTISFLIPSSIRAVSTPGMGFLTTTCAHPPVDLASGLSTLESAVSAVESALTSVGRSHRKMAIISHRRGGARRGASASDVSAAVKLGRDALWAIDKAR